MIAPGNQAEINLASFVAEPLLTDFVHLQPQCMDGIIFRELSDLLIEDDKLVVPVQLKFQDREKAELNRDEQKWANKQIKIALSQIKGAIKKVGISEIYTNHPFRGKIVFPENYFKCIHGLVIIDYKSTPFELNQQFSRRTKQGIPIHYFSYDDFITICQKLMSYPDLIDYLNERSKIPAWATPKIGNEKDAYAYYLTHKGTFNSSIVITDFQNQWDDLTTKYGAKYSEKEHEDENVLIYNNILNILSTKKPIVVPGSVSYIQNITDLKDSNRIFVTRILNRVRRIHRREISKRLIEKIIKAEDSELGFNYFAYKTEDTDTILLFLASRHNREERIKQLQVMANCVNNIYNPKRIIGIATESKTVPDGRSYDFFLIEDLPPDEDKEHIDACKKWFGGFNFDKEYDFPSDKKSRFII